MPTLEHPDSADGHGAAPDRTIPGGAGEASNVGWRQQDTDDPAGMIGTVTRPAVPATEYAPERADAPAPAPEAAVPRSLFARVRAGIAGLFAPAPLIRREGRRTLAVLDDPRNPQIGYGGQSIVTHVGAPDHSLLPGGEPQAIPLERVFPGQAPASFGVVRKRAYKREPMETLEEARDEARMQNERRIAMRAFFERRLGKEEAEILVHQKSIVRGRPGAYTVDDIQEYQPQLELPHLVVAGGYAEREGNRSTVTGARPGEAYPPATPDEYRRVNETLLEGKIPEAFDRGQFLAEFQFVQRSPRLDELFEAIRTDPALADYLRHILPAFIAYANESGEILDVCGWPNFVVFPKEGGGYGALVIDRFSGSRGQGMAYAHRGLRDVLATGSAQPREMTALVNAMNSVRTLNALALLLDLPDRIRFLPPDMAERGEAVDYRRIWDSVRAYLVTHAELPSPDLDKTRRG